MMHDIDILKGYRSMAVEIEILERQLDRLESDGAPQGYIQYMDRIGTGTTHREAARQQHIDYLMALLEQKRAEMATVIARFEEILAGVRDVRLRVILRSYYAVGMTDEAIGTELGMSTRRVNTLRNDFLRSIDFPDAA